MSRLEGKSQSLFFGSEIFLPPLIQCPLSLQYRVICIFIYELYVYEVGLCASWSVVLDTLTSCDFLEWFLSATKRSFLYERREGHLSVCI